MIAAYPSISASPDLAEVFPCKKDSIAFSKGEIIRTHMDGIYYVNRGIIRTYRQLPDRKVHVDFYLQDEFFGESCFWIGETETAVAFSDCEVTRWDRGEFEAQLGPGQTVALLRMVVERSERRKDRLVSFLLTPRILNRICHALASLRFGKVCNNGDVILPAITHEEISQMVGTRREVVTAHMNSLRYQAGVKYSRRGMILPAEFVSKWRMR
jgi:CRP-like cAMP-binding protein